MKILLDQDKCVSAGQCVFAAPEVFDQRDEDGVAFIIDENPGSSQLAAVRDAADLCPALAIVLVEEPAE